MRKLSVSVLLVILLTVLIMPLAQAETIQPRFSHILSMTAGCSNEYDTIICDGAGISMYNDTETTMTMNLLRRSCSGGPWSIYGSWSKTVTGVAAAAREEYVPTVYGYDYMVQVIVTVYDLDGNQLERQSMYSQIVSCPVTP